MKTMAEKPTYNVIVKGHDWGPGMSKIVLNVASTMTDIEDKSFEVKATKEYTTFDFETKTASTGVGTKEIKVHSIYLSDATGNKVDEASQYITLELEVHPDNVFTNPYNYDFVSGLNEEVDIDYTITQIQTLLTADGEEIKNLVFSKINQERVMKPEVEKFSKGAHEYTDKVHGDLNIPYTYYTPENSESNRPLIILLHGAGEGGVNPEIPLYGNKGVALASDSIQQYFDGAYVLAPQAKTMWMDDGTGNYTKDGQSKYTNAVLDLIETFIYSHDIDQSKVYIGGGSNGGYMTVNLLLKKPELFSAGFPICQAYASDWISDNELESLKGMPLWFIHAVTDPVVLFDKTTEPLIERIKEISEADIRLTTYDEVVDQSGLYKNENGKPYSYNDHWSWIHLFNDQVTQDGESLFEWLNTHMK